MALVDTPGLAGQQA